MHGLTWRLTSQRANQPRSRHVVQAAQHNWTREEYDAYIYAGIREQDEKGRLELAESRAEERKQNTLILAMNSKGIPLSMIAEIRGLDEDKVLQIIQNQ